MEKEYKKISLNNLLVLAHILDDFEEFDKQFKKFYSNKNDNINNLVKVVKGEFVLSSKAQKFYAQNKKIIDIISKYSTIYNFTNYIYNSYSSYDIEYFYKYLKDNEEKLDNIVKLVEKIRELGFRDIKFNEEADFKNEQYRLYPSRVRSIVCSIGTDIHFLENMELIPEYQSDIIKYKTNGSNYCMILPYKDDAKGWDSKEIILNNLLFDINRLPKSLKREDTINKILALKETKKEEIASIKDLVNLGVGLLDFEKQFNYLINDVERLNNIKSRDEFIQVLRNIRNEVDVLKDLNYNEIKENPNVTSEQIEKEKQKYLERRQWEELDLD